MWTEAFLETDKIVMENITTQKDEKTSGSTAAVALIWTNSRGEQYLDAANIGDARTVLVRSGKAIRMSYDHKATDETERKRIEDNGGVILMDKVSASLAIARSFGDPELKKWVIAEPYCNSIKLTKEDSHVIVACDGLWDVVTDQVGKVWYRF